MCGGNDGDATQLVNYWLAKRIRVGSDQVQKCRHGWGGGELSFRSAWKWLVRFTTPERFSLVLHFPLEWRLEEKEWGEPHYDGKTSHGFCHGPSRRR